MGIRPSAVSMSLPQSLTCRGPAIGSSATPRGMALGVAPDTRPSSARSAVQAASSVAVPMAGLAPSPAPHPLRRRRPSLRRRFGFAAASGFENRRPSPALMIAIASREILLATDGRSIVRAINVSCRRFARRLSANSEKARENARLAFEKPAGTAPGPHMAGSRMSLPSCPQDARQGSGPPHVWHDRADSQPADAPYRSADLVRLVVLRTGLL